MPQREATFSDYGTGELFGLVLSTDAMSAATSGRSWVGAMLRFESALARVEAKQGLVPEDAAAEIERYCDGEGPWFDPAELGRKGRLSGNPAVPFVAELKSRLPESAAQWVHFGATSQDVLDSAMMLVARDAVSLVLADLDRLAGAAAAVAEEHRSTRMAARTLLQPAAPTTFGAKVAGWLIAAIDAARSLREVRERDLAVQLGGPAGNLAALGPVGPTVMQDLAIELELCIPLVPWHTDRTRVVAAAGALARAAGVAAKVALDVSLLMQAEVGEAREPAAPGRGGSSSMPHKRNPAMATVVGAAWRQVQGHAAVLLGAMAQEHERAVGAWQSEHLSFSALCRAAGGAVATTAEMLSGLEVDAGRMAANLALVEGLAYPGASTGSAETFVDRALALYRSWSGVA